MRYQTLEFSCCYRECIFIDSTTTIRFNLPDKAGTVARVQTPSLLQLEFLKPKYWLIWPVIGLIRLVCLFPLRARWGFGHALGYLAYLLARKRRHIVKTNLELCFPSLDPVEVDSLVKKNFSSNGIGIVETALVWFSTPTDSNQVTDIEGLDILTTAAQEGRGVLLLGTHLATLDLCGAVLSLHQPFDVMYRRNKNKLLEAIMTRGRMRNFNAAIERSDVRQVISRLRQGAVVWYGPDQDYGRKHSVFAPFFGVPAATVTATARITKITTAEVVVFTHFRDEQSGRYLINLSKLPESYPTDNEVANCTIVNRAIEEAIIKDPAQYWWVHRRFKTRPPGVDRPY